MSSFFYLVIGEIYGKIWTGNGCASSSRKYRFIKVNVCKRGTHEVLFTRHEDSACGEFCVKSVALEQKITLMTSQ